MKKIIFSVFIILLIIPIFLIAYLTFAEMEKYNVDYEYSLTQRAYGECQFYYKNLARQIGKPESPIKSPAFNSQWDSSYVILQ